MDGISISSCKKYNISTVHLPMQDLSETKKEKQNTLGWISSVFEKFSPLVTLISLLVLS